MNFGLELVFTNLTFTREETESNFTTMNNSTTNETDFDEMAYLAEMLGPQRQPWDKLIPMTCVYIVMSITGIFGNLSVCCVILRIPSMRSATNYYLFSLAISDLLILLVGKYFNFTKKFRKYQKCLVLP